MNLAYKKILGKFTNLGRPPPHVGKISQIISVFFMRAYLNPVGSVCGFSMPVTSGARQTYIWMFDRLTVARCSVSNQQFINWSVMAESLLALLSEFEIGDWSEQLLLKKVWSGPTRLLHSAPGDIYLATMVSSPSNPAVRLTIF